MRRFAECESVVAKMPRSIAGRLVSSEECVGRGPDDTKTGCEEWGEGRSGEGVWKGEGEGRRRREGRSRPGSNEHKSNGEERV